MSSIEPDAEVFSRARRAVGGWRESYLVVLESVAGLDEAGAAATGGYPSVERLVEDLFRVDRRDARRLVRHAEALVPRRAMSGERLPARAPATAAAAGDGDIAGDHVQVVLDTLDRLARVPDVDPGQVAAAEETLAEAARRLAPRGLAKLAARIVAHLDPDGVAPAEPPEPEDELHLGTRRNGATCGSFEIHGRAEAEMLREVLDALSVPAGPEDTRSLPRRRAEALLDLLAQSLAPTGVTTEATSSTGTGTTPDPDIAAGDPDIAAGDPDIAAGDPDVDADAGRDSAAPPRAARPPGRATLNITMDLESLRARTGFGVLDSDTALSPDAVRRLACDAAVIPVVLGSQGRPLDVGRTARLATAHLRRALVVRDGGCAFPGCTRRPGRCSAHHIDHWVDLGETEIDNLVLLCRYHHHVLHHDQWSVHMTDGRPWFTPPGWLDPARTPRPGGRHPVG